MVELKNLSNGIQVVTDCMPFTKTVSVGIWVKTGSAYENVENNGIAHVIEHMFFKGTHKRTAQEIADEISRIGDNVNAFTGKECTVFYGTTITEYVDVLTDLLSDMVANSCLDDEALKKELGVVCDEIDMYDDAPDSLSHEMQMNNVWKDHPLGYYISGKKDVVKRFTSNMLKDFIAEHYFGHNIIVSAAGNFEKEKLYEQLEKELGCIPAFSSKGPEKSVLTAPDYTRSFSFRQKDIEQIYLNIAFPCIEEPSKDRAVCAIVNSELGGNNNSRLFMKVREECGLTYAIDSYMSSYQKAGILQISSVVNPNQTEMTLDKIYEIVKDMKDKGIEAEKLTALKNQLRIETIMGNESPKNKMEFNAKYLICFGKTSEIEDELAELEAVDADCVRRFLDTYFDTSKASMCLVGDVKRKLKHIRRFWEKN